jgi:hypothetical protein
LNRDELKKGYAQAAEKAADRGHSHTAKVLRDLGDKIPSSDQRTGQEK